MNASEIKNGLLILHGYNAGLRVWNRQLVCKYGTASESGELALSKADASGVLRHIVIMGGDGFITTQALRWLANLEIGLTMMENNGKLLLSAGRQNYPHATLTRRQALAVYQPYGARIAQWLIAEKLRGQAENLDAMGISSERVREELKAIPATRSTEELMLHEANAAVHYWGSLETIPLTFTRKDKPRIPSRWLTLGKRISPLSRRAMHAATPGQAMFNYLYGVAESICALQLASVGLNPDMGIIHTDTDNRRSMALDLIETIRPEIDKLAFEYFRRQVFSKSDFWETERGSIRLGLDVRGVLIRNAFLVENRALDYAIKLRDLLSDYKTSLARKRCTQTGDLELVHRCKYCGAPLPKGRTKKDEHLLCSDCLQIQKHESLTKGNAPGFRWTHTALAKHSQTTQAKRLQTAQWEAQFPKNELQHVIQKERQRFLVEIFPRLQSIPVPQIAHSVGISPRYASLVKKGLYVPHPCLYSKFEECCHRASDEVVQVRGQRSSR